MQVSRRLVTADTGEPIVGVWAFITDNRQVRVPYGPVRTDPTGRFTVTHDDGEYPTLFSLYVNRAPYHDPTYGTFRASVRKGQTVDLGDIPLTVRRKPEVE